VARSAAHVGDDAAGSSDRDLIEQRPIGGLPASSPPTSRAYREATAS
jgi:hypothetical protein